MQYTVIIYFIVKPQSHKIDQFLGCAIDRDLSKLRPVCKVGYDLHLRSYSTIAQKTGGSLVVGIVLRPSTMGKIDRRVIAGNQATSCGYERRILRDCWYPTIDVACHICNQHHTWLYCSHLWVPATYAIHGCTVAICGLCLGTACMSVLWLRCGLWVLYTEQEHHHVWM